MQTEIPFTITNDNITVIIDGNPIVVPAGHVQFEGLLKAALAKDWDLLRKQATPAGALQQWLGNSADFVVDGEHIAYLGEVLPWSLQQRIWELARTGKSPLAFLNFYKRLQKNPSYRSVQQLYEFLAHRNIPIEEDGTFLAYKAVSTTLKDIRTGTFDNSPGVVHKMPRNKISDDPAVECDVGFHVGALAYTEWFGNEHNHNTVICRVDPENVVSVPRDHSAQKIRVCEYTVIGFHTQPMPSTTVDREYTNDERPLDAATRLGQAIDDEIERDRMDDEEDEDDEEDDDEVDDDEDDDEDDNEDEIDDVDVDGKDAIDHRIDTHNIGAHTRNAVEAMRTVENIAKARKQLADRARRLKGKTPRQLMESSIELLRAYAKQLNIIGASKLPGGKTALVNAICKYRKLSPRKRTAKK